MNNKFICSSLCLAIVGVATTTSAESWSGSAELGFVSTSGNTDNQTTNAGLEVGRSLGKIDWAFKSAALVNSQNDTTSAEKYYFETSAQYNISERLFSKLSAAYDKDRFSGYDYQFNSHVEVGYKVIAKTDYQLDLSAGVGYQSNKLNAPLVENDNTDTQSYAIFVVGEKFDWSLSEAAKFYQVANYKSGSENSTFLFEAGITSNLLKQLNLKVAYQLKYTEEVPEGFDNTDTQSTISFVYDFK